MRVLIGFRPDSYGITIFTGVGGNCSGTHTAGKCIYIINIFNLTSHFFPQSNCFTAHPFYFLDLAGFPGIRHK